MGTVNSSFSTSYGTFVISRDDVANTVNVTFGGSGLVSGLKYETDYSGAVQSACLLIQAKMTELTANTLNGTLSNTNVQISNTNLQIANTNLIVTNTNVQVANVNTTLTAISNTHTKIEESVTLLRKRGVDEKQGIVTRGIEITEETIRRDLTTALRVTKNFTE